MGSLAERTHSKAADGGRGRARWWLASKAAAGGTGDRLCKAPVWGNKASNHSLKTPVGVEVAVGETPSLTGEFFGKTHRGLEHTQSHTLGSSTRRAQCDSG